jgi:beta-lactamase class A
LGKKAESGVAGVTLRAKDQKIAKGTKTAALTGLSLVALLGVSISQSDAKGSQAQPRKVPQAASASQLASPIKARPVQAVAAPLSSAENILASRIQSLGRAFNGDVGIAVKDVQTGFVASYDGNTYFPQQSVSKFWVALTALDRADRGQLSLNGPVTVTRSDLTLFHQPISQQVGSSGYTTTLSELMQRAMQQSDNTCNDFVLWKAGGPEAVRSFLASKGISGIRFGPGERLLQSRIAGMEWKPSYVGANFYAARNAVPMSVRRTAFENYIRDPMDGATPVGTVEALARLKKGELLSPQSTQRLLSIMSNTKTGPRRLKGGLAPGWRLAHKTGTGQVLGGTQAGYNDIGIVTAPDGRSYAVAVFIRRTSAPLSHRMETMQDTVRAVINYAQNAPAQRFAAQPVQTMQPAQANRMESVAATVAALKEEEEGGE